MTRVVTVGELLVEIMRTETGARLDEPGAFVGPYPSGAPAIFIDAVARLGTDCGIVGTVGDDGFGACVRDRLRADGVDTTGIETTDEVSTGVAFVTYHEDGSREFIYHIENAAAGAVTPETVREQFEGATAVHIAGSTLMAGDRLRKACYRGVELAERTGALVSFDPNVRPELADRERVQRIVEPILQRADIVTPSDGELRTMTGIDDNSRAVEQLLDRGVDLVARTRGADGCTLYTPDETVDPPSVAVEEVDPTGAGDVFAGALVVGWNEGMSLPRLGAFANAAGAQAVTARGPMEGIPDRETVEAVVGDQR